MSFQHPVNDSLVCGKWTREEHECVSGETDRVFFHHNQDFDLFQTPFLVVVMDVQDSTHVNCKLYKGLSDALICTDDFIAKVVQR